MKLRSREREYIAIAYRALSELYESATVDEVASGMTWYERAHDIAAQIATKYDRNVDEVAKVIAILSPLNMWSSNVNDTWAVYEHVLRDAELTKVSALQANVNKAIDLIATGLDTLSGQKVTSFYRNIMLCSESVTVDSWMHKVSGIGGTLTAMRYRAIAEAVKLIAHDQGLLPYQAQAIIWNVARRSNEDRSYRDAYETVSVPF